MKAISFLGFNPRGYEKTTYVHPTGNGQKETEFIQEALVELYHPQTLFVLLTQKAETGKPQKREASGNPVVDASGTPVISEESAWQTLQSRLDGKVDLQPINNVPEGHTQADIWGLFEKITGCIQEGDTVLFDITNGFRSLPVMALLAVSYLRVVRRVQIDGLIYGAFDAKDNQNRTPIFDLLPIVKLLEMTTATDQFLKTGNADALAKLLPDGELKTSITDIAQGLQLLRPMDVAQKAYYLPNHIRNSASVITRDIPPFQDLLTRIEAGYGKLGADEPANNKQEFLIRQKEMIEWFYAKEQYVHALSVAREWLPSLLCWHFNLDLLDKSHREEMELLLNGGTLKDHDGNIVKESQYKSEWKAVPAGKQLRSLWGGELNLANLRNDVLHAGFRPNPKPPQDIIHQIEAIMTAIREISQAWKLA